MTCRTCDCADKAADTDEWVTFAKRPEILPLSAPAAPTPLAPLAGATVDEGKPVTFSWQHQRSEQEARARRAEAEVTRLTAERDALAAQVARVEALAGQWARLAGTAINPNSREWLQACAATLRECLSGWPEMSAALAGSTGQECVRVDPDPGHEDEGYSCVTHNCAWDECPANQEDQA